MEEEERKEKKQEGKGGKSEGERETGREIQTRNLVLRNSSSSCYMHRSFESSVQLELEG